ncbi:MAG: ATP-binding protein, partial [Phycicoccus sp.]
MNTDRPLDAVASIKLKLGLLVGASVLAALLVAAVGESAGVPLWTSAPVTLATALAVTLWLARGMTSPLVEMTHAATAMAGGDYTRRVTATSSDEVGMLARAFTAMAADLATADQQRRELVATVSHELRTPLAAQRALLENLADGVVQPDDAALRAALLQSERLSALVADLLDLSRIDAGAAPLRLEDVAVDDLLRRAVAEAGIGGRRVEVRRTVSPAGLVVRADAGRLAQLVVNLVDNAIRHSPPGGTVRVDARARGGDSWLLEVHDDGPGIPADRAEQVFDRFGRGDDTGGGTGLGLAIASWVCALHGGSIAVVAPPNQDQADRPAVRGATLRAILPLHPPETTQRRLQEETVTTTPAVPPARTTPAAPAVLPSSAPPGTWVAPHGGGPYGGGSGPVLDLWPEADPRARPAVVLASLGIGAFAALTWVDRSVGLATAATLLGAGALMWVVARTRRHPWTVLCAVLAALLTSVAVVRASGEVVTLAVLAGVTVTAVGLTRAHGLLAMVAGAAAWPLSALRGLPLLGRTISATSRMSALWPLLRTVGISIVALTVFGGLFATGDAVFGSWAEAVVPDLGWDTVVARAFVLFLVAGVSLTGAYLAINPPPVDRVRMPGGGRSRPVWEWAVPVGVVVALFGGFLIAQATAMWGGREYL